MEANPAQMNKIQVVSLSLQFYYPVISGWQLYGMFRATLWAEAQTQPLQGHE